VGVGIDRATHEIRKHDARVARASQGSLDLAQLINDIRTFFILLFSFLPIVDHQDRSDPEHEALDEIAPIVDRSPVAARQLASRARRRVRGRPTVPDADINRQREVVDAFLAAVREGDFDGLLELLDPDVVLRADAGSLPSGASREMRGAQAVAAGARTFAQLARFARPALVNGAAGFIVARDRHPVSVAGFSVTGGKIVEIDILADPERLRQGGTVRHGGRHNAPLARQARCLKLSEEPGPLRAGRGAEG
jgi:ketosteroid isomerase-like protein